MKEDPSEINNTAKPWFFLCVDRRVDESVETLELALLYKDLRCISIFQNEYDNEVLTLFFPDRCFRIHGENLIFLRTLLLQERPIIIDGQEYSNGLRVTSIVEAPPEEHYLGGRHEPSTLVEEK